MLGLQALALGPNFFYLCSGEMILGPDTFGARSLPTEPAPQTLLLKRQPPLWVADSDSSRMSWSEASHSFRLESFLRPWKRFIHKAERAPTWRTSCLGKGFYWRAAYICWLRVLGIPFIRACGNGLFCVWGAVTLFLSYRSKWLRLSIFLQSSLSLLFLSQTISQQQLDVVSTQG